MKTTETLLASSPTIQGIEKMLNKYMYSEKYTITEDLTIKHPEKNINDCFKVVCKKGRYRLIGIYTTL